MAIANPTRISFARILVPTDFSEMSDRALEYAKAIGKQDHAEILLAHVFAPVTPITPPEASWFDEDAAVQRLNEQLEEMGYALRSEGVKARAVSLSGSVQQEILSAVDREQADLIILGMHAKAGWERLLLGSDAEAVYRRAAAPVLVIGPKATPIGDRPWQPKAITCATDLSVESAPAVAYACLLAEQYQANFTLFHLVDPTVEEGDQIRVRFEQAVHEQLAGSGLPKEAWRLPVTWSPLDTAILNHASEIGADLIVMGGLSHTLLKRHFLRRTSSRVIDSALCPVLIVHC